MKKNVAGQIIGCQLISKTDGSAVTTGTTTVYVTGDGGVQAAGSVGAGACTHEGNGFWTYTPAQAETNYDHIAFTFVNTSACNATLQVYPAFPQTGDNFARLGAPAGASVSADIATVAGYIDTEIGTIITNVAAVKADTSAILLDTGTNGVVVAAASKTGYSLAATGLDAIASAATGMVEIAKAIWDRVLSGATHNIVNSAGRKLRELGTTIAFSGTVNDIATTTTTFKLDAGASAVDNFYRDQTLIFTDGALSGQARSSFTYTGATRTITLDEPLTSAPANGVGVLIRADHVHSVTSIQAGLATQLSVNDIPTNAELATALGTADDAVLAQVALVKAKTDSLNFTVAGQLDANVQSINDIAITGNGSTIPFTV